MALRGILGAIRIGTDVVAEVRNWEFSREVDELDTTVMNAAGLKTGQPSGINTSGSGQCYLDPTDTAGQIALAAALAAGTSVTLELYTAPIATDGTKFYQSTDCKIMGDSVGADVGGAIEYNFNFRSNVLFTLETVGS